MSLIVPDDREERGDWIETRLGYRACVSCGREHLKEHLEDGWCPQCNSETPADLSARHRAAALEGYRQTARMLRRMGYPEEARWYEGRVK